MNEMKEAVGNWREAKQFSPADENDFLRWLDKADTEEKLFSRLTFWFTFRGLPADQNQRYHLVQERARELRLWNGLELKLRRWQDRVADEYEQIGKEAFAARIGEDYADYINSLTVPEAAPQLAAPEPETAKPAGVQAWSARELSEMVLPPIRHVVEGLLPMGMGVLVAKTRTRWGRFRPWIFSGTLLNALVLYALFAAPVLDEAALMVYFSVVYILWGVTYTMMDIPYWSMIPAVTRTPKDRENLSMVGRTCAGVGAALIAMFTMLLVGILGGDSERAGFRWVALIVAVIFAVTELVCCISMKETTPSEMKTATVKEMFSALFRNDQAMVVVGSIVLINSALYLTSNFIIYFFKYDLGGAGWKATYTLFSTVGGAAQILGMMVLYPLLRKKFSSTQVFYLSLLLALCGYGTLLVFCLTGLSHSLALLCIPGVVVFACNGMLTVLTTLFLSNSVDYGQLKTGRREESVIFSMQTFVVKAASGVAVFLTGIGLDLIGLVGNTEETGPVAVQSAGTLLGLRLMMTVLPMLVLAGALVLFRRKFVLTDARAAEISAQLHGEEAHHD